MNKVLAIIDGDGLVYHSSKETLRGSIDILDEKIQNIFDKTKATHYIIFISNSPYFRHKIDPFYKIGRSKYTSNLKWLKTLKNYLIEGWGAESMNLVEADDLVAYWYNKHLETIGNPFDINEITGQSDPKLPETFEKIICTPDKDLLNSIPGKHFNYTYKLEDKTNPDTVIKGWWIETTETDAKYFKAKQLLTGDSADGIKCLNKVGDVKAGKILEGIHPKQYFPGILEEYIKEFGVSQGIFEFQKNYRLLHLLDCDEDFMREFGMDWKIELPKFREVPNKEVVKDVEDLKF